MSDIDKLPPMYYNNDNPDYHIFAKDIDARRFVKDTPYEKLHAVSTRDSTVIIPNIPNDIIKFLDSVSHFIRSDYVEHKRIPYLKISDILVNKENGGVAVYFKLDHRSEPNTFFKYQSDLQNITDLSQLTDKWLTLVREHVNDKVEIDPKTQSYTNTCGMLIRPLLAMVWPFDVGTDFSLIYKNIAYPNVYKFVGAFNNYIIDIYESELVKSGFDIIIKSKYTESETGTFLDYPTIELEANFKIAKLYNDFSDFIFENTFNPVLKIDLNKYDIIFLSHLEKYESEFEFADNEDMECTGYDFKLLKHIAHVVELAVNADKSSNICVRVSKNEIM